MKLSSAIVLIAASVLFAKAETQQVTPAEQRIAAARQQIASDPKKPEAYNNLALAFISRAHETASPDYDRQAAEAIATGLSLAPQDFQLRKAHVALLLDQHEFGRARDEAKDLNLHNPDDATVHGYLARAYLGLGDYQHAET
jgi:predicted Zn-dependent protease